MPTPHSIPKFAVVLIFSFIVINASSQSVVNSTGNTIKDSTYYIEYSIGEISISTLENKTNTATQGLLQPNFREQAAQAIIVTSNKNLFDLYLQILTEIPFRTLRTTNYNYLCTILNNRKNHL